MRDLYRRERRKGGIKERKVSMKGKEGIKRRRLTGGKKI